ncbi:MAG: hypothetical protein IJ449_06160 [Clostridia bacterium]|nr:hypothetical protein [Clostridia bacterium]
MKNETQLASHYCENLGQSVILCREVSEVADKSEPTAAQYRCLSSHLCGRADCTHDLSGTHDQSYTQGSSFDQNLPAAEG